MVALCERQPQEPGGAHAPAPVSFPADVPFARVVAALSAEGFRPRAESSRWSPGLRVTRACCPACRMEEALAVEPVPGGTVVVCVDPGCAAHAGAGTERELHERTWEQVMKVPGLRARLATSKGQNGEKR